jgi:hypothetical protein
MLPAKTSTKTCTYAAQRPAEPRRAAPPRVAPGRAAPRRVAPGRAGPRRAAINGASCAAMYPQRDTAIGH